MLHNTIGPLLWSSGSAVINIVSNIPGGYWIILLAKDYSALSVLSLSACSAVNACSPLWAAVGL